MIKAVFDLYGTPRELARFELLSDGTVRSEYRSEDFRADIERGTYRRGTLLFPGPPAPDLAAFARARGVEVAHGKAFWDVLDQLFMGSSFISVRRLES